MSSPNDTFLEGLREASIDYNDLDSVLSLAKLENGGLNVNSVSISDALNWKFFFQNTELEKITITKAIKRFKELNKDEDPVLKKVFKSTVFELDSYWGEINEIPLRFYPLDAEMSSFNVYIVKDFEKKTLELKLKAYSLTTSNNCTSLLIDDTESLVRDYFDKTYKRYVKYMQAEGLEKKIVDFTAFFIEAVSRNLPLCSELIIADEPAILSDDKDIWNLHCIDTEDFKKFDRQKLVVWLDWLKKIPTEEHRKVFCCWVGSLFDDNNKGRNILFLQGSGQTGKSAAANSIYDKIRDMIPTGVAAFSTENVEARWLNSVAMGKRFMMYPDSSDLHILSNQVIKTITGNDFSRVEFKGKSEFTSRLYSKVMVVTNFTPYVSYRATHEYSRYLLIPIGTYRSEEYGNLSETKYQKLLNEGVEDFLKLCYNTYVKEGRPDDFCREGSFCYEYAKNVTMDLTNAAADKFISSNCEIGKEGGFYINKNSLVSFLFKFFEAKYVTPANQKRLVHETLSDIANKEEFKQVRLANGETVILGLKVTSPTRITTLEEVLSGTDKKETLYQIEENDLPEGISNEDKSILLTNSYSRHYV